MPAARAEGKLLVRVFLEPVLILPSSDSGNMLLTFSANPDILTCHLL